MHSSHGGATVVDGGVLTTVVDKMVNQPGTKHHGTMENLKQCFRGQKLTVECWPRPSSHDGGVAGREEEERAQQVLGEYR